MDSFRARSGRITAYTPGSELPKQVRCIKVTLIHPGVRPLHKILLIGLALPSFDLSFIPYALNFVLFLLGGRSGLREAAFVASLCGVAGKMCRRTYVSIP